MSAQSIASTSDAIAVFDSGVGGLSILKALRASLPLEHYVYYADTANAPYGEKDDAFILAHSLEIAHKLIAAHKIKALVVACNTATAVAIHALRKAFPDLILIGVEPALKPACALSQTKHIAVLATAGTLKSHKFHELHHSLQDKAFFVPIACNGLAAAIEAHDQERIEVLCHQYLSPLNFGNSGQQIDTVVLGCTHYPFALEVMQKMTGKHIQFLETGAPVAKHTKRCLENANLLAAKQSETAQTVQLMASANLTNLYAMAQKNGVIPFDSSPSH